MTQDPFSPFISDEERRRRNGQERVSKSRSMFSLSNIMDSALETGKTLLSGRDTLNTLSNAYTPWDNVGDKLFDKVNDIPRVGHILESATDTLTSPLSLATIGGGSLLSGAARGLPLVGRPLSALMAPVVEGSVGRRLAGEALANIGGVAGYGALNKLTEDMPSYVQTPASLAGGLLGGGLAIKKMKPQVKSVVGMDDVDALESQVNKLLEDNTIDSLKRAFVLVGAVPEPKYFTNMTFERFEDLKKVVGDQLSNYRTTIRLRDKFENLTDEELIRQKQRLPDRDIEIELDRRLAYNDWAWEPRNLQHNDYSLDEMNRRVQHFQNKIFDLEDSGYKGSQQYNEQTAELNRLLTLKSRLETPISGGASAGPLYNNSPVKPGLTFTDHANNAWQSLINVLGGHGIKENEIATPLKRKYLEDKMAIQNQGRIFSSYAVGAQELFQIDPKTGLSMEKNKPWYGHTIQDTAFAFGAMKPYMSNQQYAVMDRLRSIQDSFTESMSTALSKVGQEMKLLTNPIDPEGFYLTRWGTLADDGQLPTVPGRLSRAGGNIASQKDRVFTTMKQGMEATYKNAAGEDVHYKYPSLSNALESYANDVANKVSELNLVGELKKLPKYKGRTPGLVDLYQASRIELDPAISDVLNKEINKSASNQNEYMTLWKSSNAVLKGMWASTDSSFQGIQGLLIGASNPILAAKLQPAIVKSLFSDTTHFKFLSQFDEVSQSKGLLDSVGWAAHNLHLAGSEAVGTDIEMAQKGLLGRIGKLPLIKETNRMFSVAGDFYRLSAANAELERLKSLGRTITNDDLNGIAQAVNRGTGYSNKAFGGSTGEATLFASKYLQSQLENITSALSLKGNYLSLDPRNFGLRNADPEVDIARKYLIKLVGLGVGATVTANTLRGQETDFDPRSSNFMRIRDVKGTDVSLFGPWDSLVRGIAHTVGGDYTYMMRTKSNPIISTAWNLIQGQDLLGRDTHNPESIARNLILPFSVRDFGNEPLMTSLVGFFGGKATPLTESENLDKALESNDITKDDPNYLIKRRDFLYANPDLRPSGFGPDSKYIADVTGDISNRERENALTTIRGDQTLAQFRDQRILLQDEKRNKLASVVDSFDNKPKTDQERWLKSYYDIYSNPDIQNPITGKPVPEQLDLAFNKWRQSNGEAAWDFVQRYTMSGKSDVETQYLKDLHTLQQVGFFDTAKYQNLNSDIPEATLEHLRDFVNSARSTDSSLRSLPFSYAARQILSDAGVDYDVIQDVVHIGHIAYQNPDFIKLRQLYHKELLWFNPNVTWDQYQNDQGSNDQIKLHGGKSNRAGPKHLHI